MKKLTPAALNLLSEVVQNHFAGQGQRPWEGRVWGRNGPTTQVDMRRDRPAHQLNKLGLIELSVVDDKFPPRFVLRPTQAGIQRIEESK